MTEEQIQNKNYSIKEIVDIKKLKEEEENKRNNYYKITGGALWRGLGRIWRPFFMI